MIKTKEPKIKRLYFDIETSYYLVKSWNVGYNLNIDYTNIVRERAIICICYKWEHENVVHALTWDKGDDKSMILKFLEILKSTEEVIGHNGDKYDLRFFRTRCIYHGIVNMPQIKSIDTLKISRREFKFGSNRLDAIGGFLKLGRKIKTDFSLWDRVIEKNDSKSLQEMVKYCIQDVRLLEKVYNKLKGFTKPKSHVGILKGGDKCDCPSCGSHKTISDGNRITASGMVNKKMQCNSCGTYFQVSMTTYNKSREIKEVVKN